MLLNDGENPKNVPQLQLEARHKLHERFILYAVYSYCVEDVPLVELSKQWYGCKYLWFLTWAQMLINVIVQGGWTDAEIDNWL